MGAFGLGTNANPAPYAPGNLNGNTPPNMIQQVVPGYQPPGQMAQPTDALNWNPAVTHAWTDPGAYVSSYNQNHSGGIAGGIQKIGGGGDDSHYSPNYTAMPWQNIVRSYFGAGSSLNLQGTQGDNSYQRPGFMGNYGADPSWTQTYGGHYNPYSGYQGGTNNPVYQNQFGYNPNDTSGSSSNPQTYQELLAQAQGLNTRDLMGLTNNFDMVQRGFGQASQALSNAYGNSNYASQSPLTHDQASDWLQASYNTLTSKMASSYLV